MVYGDVPAEEEELGGAEPEEAEGEEGSQGVNGDGEGEPCEEWQGREEHKQKARHTPR